MKRNLVVATLVVFAFSSVFLLSSCAKKQVITEEKKMEALAPEVAKVEEEKPAVPAAKEAEMKRAEEAKIERLKELEEAKKTEAAIDEEKAWMERRAAKFEAESIYFDFDKSFIKLEHRPVLQEKAAFLKDYPDMRVRIEGNCDERGTNEYNLALGDRRGSSSKNFLISLGIAADRIETISYGEERPRTLGHDEASWSQNRRDDFALIR